MQATVGKNKQTKNPRYLYKYVRACTWSFLPISLSHMLSRSTYLFFPSLTPFFFLFCLLVTVSFQVLCIHQWRTPSVCVVKQLYIWQYWNSTSLNVLYNVNKNPKNLFRFPLEKCQDEQKQERIATGWRKAPLSFFLPPTHSLSLTLCLLPPAAPKQ